MNESERLAVQLTIIERVLFAALDFLERAYPAQIVRISIYRDCSGLKEVKVWAEGKRQP